ncbi:hypothetical protein LCM27_20450 [Ruegeria marisrubri]|uniref:hypothetical protein n=1 Tax=Ruegeria marisrubri TaxID=1685379 RepID=UPI001CD7475C|nr:hypothetical protein [Ruegeria marisrubri]MCA0908777.1 hypothetical protein [Ruegeria marisrubri]
MFDVNPTGATALHKLFHDHVEKIQNAALLLGGQSELARVQRIVDDLNWSPQITSRTRREIMHLNQLFTLQHVHDEGRPESAFFAMLDPASPEVENICLLTDRLEDAIQRDGITTMEAQLSTFECAGRFAAAQRDLS